MAPMYITFETGTVKEIEEGPGRRIALVEMDPPETQERCATCRMCSSRDGCERILPARIEGKDLRITRGMRVEVEVSRPSLYLPILVTLLLPLAGMVAGGAMVFLLFADLEAKDLVSAALAVGGGAIFFVIGYLFFRENMGRDNRSARVRRLV